MRSIYYLAKNTFYEAILSKVLNYLILFAFVLIIFSKLLANLSFAEQERILVHFGFAAVNFSLFFITLFLGSSLLFKEFDTRTIFLILSKPIRRSEFLLGKFFGFLGVIFLIEILLFLILLGLFKLNDVAFQSDFLITFAGIFLDGAVFLAILVFFSSITSYFLCITFSVLLLFVSHAHDTLKYFASRAVDTLLPQLATALDILTPNFDRWNWKNFLFAADTVSTQQILMGFANAFFWTALLLSLSVLTFRKKDCV